MSTHKLDKSRAAARASEAALVDVRAQRRDVLGVVSVVVFADGSAGVAWCGDPNLAPHLGSILQAAAEGERQAVIAQASPDSSVPNG